MPQSLAPYSDLTVSPRSYGALTMGSGISQANRLINRATLAAAVAAAISTGYDLVLPPGRIEIEFAGGTPAINVTGNLVARGAGRDRSVIYCGPETPGFVVNAFTISAGVHARFEDLTISGPTNPGADGINNQASSGIYIGKSSAAGSCRLRNVKIDGNFYYGVNCISGSAGATGEYLMEYQDCDIKAYIQAAMCFADDNSLTRFHAYNTRFGCDPAAPSTYGHTIYVHNHINVDMDHCRFHDNGYWSFHCNGGNGSGNLYYWRMQNTIFESTCTNAVITASSGRVLVSKCEFYNNGSGVTLRNSADIEQCKLYTAGNGAIVVFGGYGAFGVNVSHCKLKDAIVIAGTGAVWRVSDCDFEGTGTMQSTSADAYVYVGNCDFNMNSGYSGCNIRYGYAYLDRCTFRGTGVSSGALQILSSTVGALKEVVFNNCRFLTASNQLRTNAAGSGVVRGEGNYFNPVALAKVTSAEYQYIQPRRGISPSVIASASEIDLDPNYDVFHVSGTATINNIYVGDSTVARFFAARICLIADGAWALAGGGNIRPQSTSARVVNEAIILQYDPAAGLWYEVY